MGHLQNQLWKVRQRRTHLEGSGGMLHRKSFKIKVARIALVDMLRLQIQLSYQQNSQSLYKMGHYGYGPRVFEPL